MSKHTPGPWVAELGREGSFSIEADRQGITGNLLVLASRNCHPLLAEQMHANARLIAAAPDLLRFAEAMRDTHATGSPAHAEACAVISKATGEQA